MPSAVHRAGMGEVAMAEGKGDPEVMSPIANALHEYVEATGDSLYQLSQRAGLPTSTVYRLADRTRPMRFPPTDRVVEAIAGAVPKKWAAAVKEAAAETGDVRFTRPKRGTPLQMLICDRLIELDLTYNEVTERTGGHISRALLSTIVTGRTHRPTDETVKWLSIGLDIPEEDIRAAAAASKAGRVYELPPKAQTLTVEGWKQVQEFIDYMLEQEKRRGV